MRRPEATDHHLVRHGDRLPFDFGAGAGACKLSRVRHRRRAGQGKAGQGVRQPVVPCWLAVGGDGDGCPGRQRHSSSCTCRYGSLRARFVKLLRFCILTTDMEFADGGSRATGASAFTMVVVVSGGSVLVFVRPKCSELIRAEALAPWHFALSALSRRWAQPSPQTNNQLATALV